MRTRVRIWVTYAAAGYLFGFGPLFIILLYAQDPVPDSRIVPGVDAAKNLFATILPISSGIVAYWFAARGADKLKEPNPAPNESAQKEQH